MTTNAVVNTPIDVNEVFDALEAFINKRPRLEFANYGAIAPYRAEIRSIAKDKKRAVEALAAARRSTTQDPALLADSLKRAFSGRLEWVADVSLPMLDVNGDPVSVPFPPGHLEYTTGQYFPTEYRKAAASVLETYTSLLAQQWNAAHPQKFQFRDMADVKAANAAIGGHWFERSTMRFFNTRIESKLMTRGSSGRQVFITSERCDETTPRKYTVREALTDGSIDTVGEFQQHATLQDARDAVVALS